MLDIQGSSITRSHAIQNVGVCDLNYPVSVDLGSDKPFTTSGLWTISVELKADQRGAHMSRFVEAIDALNEKTLDLAALVALGKEIRNNQAATYARCAVDFTWHRRVFAPVTGKASYNPHRIKWSVECRGDAHGMDTEPVVTVSVDAHVKSLCPCSKAISERGAHNQRSTVRVDLRFPASLINKMPNPDQIVAMMEKNASSPVYALLKREDEKFVTERAYDNPGFVEDLVRGIATSVEESLANLGSLSGVADIGWRVRVVNHESIHAHDCFAEISSGS